MKCPFCHVDNDRVIDTRASEDGIATRRRRECLDCKRRYTTYERIEGTTIKIVKKDGSREPFDRAKIKRGLEKACWKRPISDAQLETIVSDVENEIETNYEAEVDSPAVGEMVMRRLRAGSGGVRAFCQRLPPIQGCPRFCRRTAAHASRSQTTGIAIAMVFGFYSANIL